MERIPPPRHRRDAPPPRVHSHRHTAFAREQESFAGYEKSNGMKKSDFVVVLIAAGLVLIGNWVLVQWLPAAFGFAKPRPMRRRLHPAPADDVEDAPIEEPASGVAADESGSARRSRNFRDEGFAGK